jgi:hypothetical protein
MNSVATYTQLNNRQTLMFSDITSRLPQACLAAEEADESLGLEDLRYHYALGLAYGMSYHERSEAESPSEDE